MPDMSANNRHINWAKRKVIQGLQTGTVIKKQPSRIGSHRYFMTESNRAFAFNPHIRSLT